MPKHKIIEAIQGRGGEVFIVGGAVRDELLGRESKDIDFLIRFLEFAKIKDAISHLGKIVDQEIGGKVSTLKATIEGEEFDIAIPRTSETSTGAGHGDFDIVMDPHAPVEADLGRRDFTINAMAKKPEGEIVDPFGGLEDLNRKLIRAVGNPQDRFMEDPLRMLRALQFAARFRFEIEKETAEAIQDLRSLLKTISNERIFMEFEKAWIKGDSEFFANLLENLKVGEELFGSFQPVGISLNGSDEEKVIGNFVSFFLFGNPATTAMRPTNVMIEHLEIARKLFHVEPQIWKWSKRDNLHLLKKVFQAKIDKGFSLARIVDRIDFSINRPLSGKELDISGHELMELGLQGKEIGETQHKLIEAIFNQEISNNKEEIIKWIKTNLKS